MTSHDASTLAGKNVSFLCQSFIVHSGKYIACQGVLLFAYIQTYANLQHCVSGKAIGMRQPGLKESDHGQTSAPCLFLSLLKRKNTSVLLGNVCLKAAGNKLFVSSAVTHKPKPWQGERCTALGCSSLQKPWSVLLLPGLCSSASGVGGLLMLLDGTFWKNLNAFK